MLGMDVPLTPIEAAFAAMPAAQLPALRQARGVILAEADRLGVGPLTETLKWGQPAYLTQASKSGTTIRLGLQDEVAALFVHCQTTIIEDARQLYGGVATFCGNRSLLLDGDPRAAVHVICAALTYHRRGKLP